MNAALEARQAIARDLSQGPAWARSFQSAKPVVTAMVEDGELRRVAPSGGRHCNMIALTRRGALAYFGSTDGVAFVSGIDEECEFIAEMVAKGGSLAEAARQLGLSYPTVQMRWAKIRRDLGEQAV